MTSPAGAPRTVAAAILRSVAAFGDRIALVAADGGALSYAALGARIGAAIGALRALGCEAGDRIGIWLPNGLDWPVWQLACALLGCVVVPLNLRYRSGELHYVLEKSGARLIVGQRRFLNNDLIERLEELAQGPIGAGQTVRITAAPALERVLLLDGADVAGTVALSALSAQAASADDMAALAAARQPRDPLWLFWTSGTTNHPKGVLIAQDAVENIWNWTSLAGYDAEDRVLTTFPLFYIAGHFWCLLGPLLHGAASILGQLFTSAEVVALCKRERVTLLCGVPVMLRQFVAEPGGDRSAFAHVRKGWFGGGTITPEEVADIKAAIGFTTLLQVYGMTELLGFSMSTHPNDPDEAVANTSGTPLPGHEFRLVHPGTEQDVPEGEPGELLHRGRRMLDYFGMDPAERARFYTADNWFRTGDLLRRRSDGRYTFVGRIKDLIKVSGENVAAGEIEDLLRSHPELREVAVLGVPDPYRGEVPVAFVELAPGSVVDERSLREWCRGRAAPFKVPRAFHFVAPSEWPRTPSGKLAKWQLSSLA